MAPMEPTTLDPREWQTAHRLIRDALREDVGSGDITTEATVPPELSARARLVAREAGVLAGLPIAAAVFDALAPGAVHMQPNTRDGERFEPQTVLAELEGPAAVLLTGERLALNLLQRLSGVATLTARFVEKTAGTRAKIYDTRKTTPGLRALQKYAVRVGGGRNHRMGLWDQALIKDNHIACLARTQGVSPDEVDLGAAIERIRALRPRCFVEVEVACARALDRVLAARPDAVLLDNMTPEQIAALVSRVRGSAAPVVLEASGGITLETAADYAATGVDRLSVGALTHSAPALDLALEFSLASTTGNRA